MTSKINLQEQIKLFKSQMKEANDSLEDLRCQFHVEEIKIHTVKSSFADLIKLMNHELIESFDNSKSLIEQMSSKIIKNSDE